jgi:DNA-binding response OmpR family regulator
MAHILVIDDEADIRIILEKLFKKEGHTVDIAGDGKAGMRLVEKLFFKADCPPQATR